MISIWNVGPYIGVALGLTGAVLVAGATARSRCWGFGLWIASNACHITWTVNAAAWGLLGMYVVYSITSLMGFGNNRTRPSRAQPAST